ncbi:MAG: regulatory protein [Actinomycetota bacterium]|nr:regulatory protein [Actinomycetota bacterium]
MTDAIGSEGEVRLARVTYLPGVQPPSQEPTLSEPIATSTEHPDLPPKRLHNFPTGELERLTPQQLQARMNEITKRDEPEADVDAETPGERSARAHNVSMYALTRKGLSSAEMTDLLRSRDLEAGDVAFEITRLEQVGLLNDSELAATLVMQLRERKGLGRSAITSELRRRKLDPSAIEEALADAYDSDGDDELTRARAIALKRAPQLRSLDAETARRRLGAFLMRKGYSGSVVASAVASALAPQARSAEGPRFR